MLEDSNIPTQHTPQNLQRRRALIRVASLALMLVVAWSVAWYFDLQDHLTTESIRGFMADAGWWGIVLYVVAFVVGNLFHVPSNAFLAAAVLSYGFFPGYPLAYASNVLSLIVSFIFVRTVGGRALTAVERPWVRWALNRIDDHPISSVALLRLTMAGAPWLNYLLAMSSVRLRDYAIGSAIGLAPHLAVIAGLVAFAVEQTTKA